jgi:dihydrofolate reductase
MVKLTIIVARALNGVIGNGNKLPWNIPEDMKHFRTYTKGKPVIMGRLTHESIGMVLPGRMNIIVSRNPDYRVEGAVVVNSLPAALELVHELPEAVLIGGMQLYEYALNEDLVDKCVVTQLEDAYSGDAFFPALDETKWEPVMSQQSFPSCGFTIIDYRRRKAS